jgi:hypothetical protein
MASTPTAIAPSSHLTNAFVLPHDALTVAQDFTQQEPGGKI